MEPATGPMPWTPLTLLTTLVENPSPVLWVTVTSTWPVMAARLRWKASIIVGSTVPMPKITMTPMTMATVVRNERSLRPHRYRAASVS